VSAASPGDRAADRFFAGGGRVVTGSIASLKPGVAAPLMTIPGEISVSATINRSASTVDVAIANPTNAALRCVIETAGADDERTVAAGGSTSVAIDAGAGQAHIQIFPNAELREVVTLVLSTENAGEHQAVVGHALSGPAG
jgi:hypothetical protein